MATIVSISSQVARGHVGNSSIMFALQRLGHKVWSLPSVMLSNHPGYSHFGGARIKPAMLRPVLEALEINGWLEQVDGVLTGYLPTREHVRFAVEVVELVRAANPLMRFLCDPVLGDDPKGLYIDQAAAETLRLELMPRADIVTPNRFELEWLLARPVEDEPMAVAAMNALEAGEVLATSVRAGGDELANLLRIGADYYRTGVTRRARAPHGTGDLMAALYFASRLEGARGSEALARATAIIESLLEAGGGADELALISAQEQWVNAEPWKVTGLKVNA